MKITDVTPQVKNKNRVSVYADGQYCFSLDSADALRLGVKVGAEISAENLKVYNLESNLSKAKEKAFDIVTRKAVTEKELRGKLADKGYDKTICNMVIETMKEYNYINDFDYCERFLDYAVSRGWGRSKMAFELRRRGVEDTVAQEVLSSFEDDPVRRISDIIDKKFSDADFADFKQKQKIVRFFASRGFDFDSINTAISGKK